MRSRMWLALVAAVAVAACAAGLLIWQPWAGSAREPEASAGNGQTATFDNGLTARAAFPASPAVFADVETTTTTAEMLASAPASFRSLGTASFSITGGGQFPAGGATVTFELPAPLEEQRGALIAHWNEENQEWEPVETRLSEDRRHASASVNHFSKYGFWDYAFNAVNQVAGNAAPSGVLCDSPLPAWADPQYVDDINGPILWCGGRDNNNAEILVAKMKMNRGSAALVTTAIKPSWVWSDLWESMGPETILQVLGTAGMTGGAKLADGYLVQPLGEYNFGFSRSDIEAHYADGRWDKPLVQVWMGWEFTAFGMLYDELKNAADGNVAGAVAMLALGQCSHDMAGAPGTGNAVSAFGALMGCVGSSFDAVEKGALTFLTKKKLIQDAGGSKVLKPVLAKLKFLARAYTAVSGVQKIFTTAGDINLPDISRQFLYQPSLSAIKEAAAKKKAASTSTKFSTLDPWRDGSSATASSAAGTSGGSCTSSGISPRADGFRCFASGVFDPCYQNPASSSEFLCLSWNDGKRQVTRLTGMDAQGIPNTKTPPESSIVMAELSDGTICRRATGAGPQGVPGYPYWTGICTGPSAGVWRVGEEDVWQSSSSTYPLYAPEKQGGNYRAAVSVGAETSPARLLEVKTAYR